MKYLGLDVGSKTLGMATSDRTGLIATAYNIIRHNEDYEFLVEEIIKIVNQEKIEAIVLGFPKNMNNTIGEKGKLSEKLKEELEKKLTIPIYLQDERLTTKEAEHLLISNNTSRKKRKKVIDAVAATIILQSFLDKEGKKR